MTQLDNEQLSLIVVICAGVILLTGILLMCRQLRAKALKERAAAQRLKSKNEPPVHTVELSSSGSTFPVALDLERSQYSHVYGISRSASDRFDIDNLWEFRKDQRRDFILEKVVQQTVTCKSCTNTLNLPHESVLSQRWNQMNSTGTHERSESGGKKDKFLKRSRLDSISSSDKTTDVVSLSTQNSPENANAYTHTACSLCSEEYKEGDTVCWSQNGKCVHAYHLECKVAFLMNTDECTLCQRNFLHDDGR